MIQKLNRTWTEEDDRRILQWRAAGRSTISIAAAVKRTASAVNARLAVLRARDQSAKDVAADQTSKSDEPHRV
jgi:hypothetical protein